MENRTKPLTYAASLSSRLSMGTSPQIRSVATATGSKMSNTMLHRRLLRGGPPKPSSLTSSGVLRRPRTRAKSAQAMAAPKMVATRDVYISLIPVATTTVWGIRATASQVVVKSR